VERKATPEKAGKRHGVGRPSAAEAAVRIEKLLDVAARLFLEKGYEGTSVGEIARRANASKETLYSRYPTKKDLFTAVMQRRAEEGFQILTDVVHSSKPVDDALRSYARILIFPLVDKETLRLLRAIIGNAETLPEPAEAFWATGPTRVYEIVSEMIQSRMARGDLRKADPVQAMHFFVASCTGRFWSQGLLAVQPKVTKAEVNAYIEQVIQAFLAIYAPGH
jgi:TetR/AcrR family transcriptional regulator, mexJK operon transcriptional repressor